MFRELNESTYRKHLKFFLAYGTHSRNVSDGNEGDTGLVGGWGSRPIVGASCHGAMPHLSLHSLQGTENSSSLRIRVYRPGDPVSGKFSQRSEGKKESCGAGRERKRTEKC